MKDQFFGDERDYFKYDLMLDLMCCLGITRFTNIVMLTPPKGKLDYKLENRRPALYKLLKSASNERRQDRRVVRLRQFFRKNYPCIEYLPYKDDEFFKRENRDSYFCEIPEYYLKRAVILVDPDTGLAPASKVKTQSPEYVLPCEMVGLKDRMCPSSVLVMFQFQRGMSWADRLDYIKKKAGAFDAIYGKGVIFACWTKDWNLRVALQNCLRGHAQRHCLRTCSPE